jgi:hypothetical protein
VYAKRQDPFHKHTAARHSYGNFDSIPIIGAQVVQKMISRPADICIADNM